jgi:5-methyltetrahydrofolate--homocysteine methyltransferase
VAADRILDAAEEQNVDVIGLSGLITPSLDEMAHVAREMERRKIRKPLLIGGATTSKLHTALRIAPQYGAATVHVHDASRAVGVISDLLSDDRRDAFVANTAAEYGRLRDQYRSRDAEKLLTLEQARERGLKIDWAAARIDTPASTGTRVLPDVPLQELLPFIDWSPFFHAWELRGQYPGILDDGKIGERARELFDDAQALLREIVEKKLLRASAVYGIFPTTSSSTPAIARRKSPRSTRFGSRPQNRPARPISRCPISSLRVRAGGRTSSALSS